MVREDGTKHTFAQIMVVSKFQIHAYIQQLAVSETTCVLQASKVKRRHIMFFSPGVSKREVNRL